MASDDGDGDGDLLLVRQLPMDMDNDVQGCPARRLAHLLPPLALAPGPPPFRPPPPPAAAASAESRVSFRGWLGAPRYWDLWVTKLRPIHHLLWRKLGILDAVLATTYRFKRDSSAVLHVASFWSPNTNTFAFPWGEATLTLQDVAVLGGFPALGSPVPAPLPPQWRPDEAALNGVRLGFNRSACKKAHHSAWVKHFLTDTATDAVIEHAAFLALWLTRFVLPGHPESTMRQSVFPLAVRLAHGERVALGPAVLASLYRDLREMKAYLVAAGAAATGGNADLLSPLSVYAPLYILQLWVWEQFPALWAGKVNPIKDGEPRAARWHDVSKKMNPTVLHEVLSSGRNFVWQPYTSSVQAWKQHSGWVRGSDVAGNEELRSLAHCLRASELVGMDCIEQYLPHRVAMQFGLDQDVPGDVKRANEDWAVAWETYDLEGKNVAFFIPQSEPGLTARYAQWWRQPLSPSNLDVGAASVVVECKVSKRKVKKTLAAMEAEAEKERKMKKVRISPNDKKRKVEELYDAKLSDWLAAARNGSSGTGGGSCKRGSSPKSDTGSDKALLADVETIKDSIVLLVPRKQMTPPALKPKKDKNMNPAISDEGNFIDNSLVGMKEKGVKLKDDWTGDVNHLVNQQLCKEKRAVVSTEISTFTEDYNAEWSGMISKNTNELVRGETPDVSNRPEEAKPPVPMDKEESSDHLSDGFCKEAAIEGVVTVDKLPDISDGLERGVTATPEEKRLNFPIDKSLDVTDRPEEGATASLELEKESNLAVDESCGVSNRPEELAAPVMKEKEEKVTTEEVLAVMGMNPTEKNIVIVREADEDNAVSEEVVRATVEVTNSIEVAPQSKEEIDAGVINNCHDATTLSQEVLPIQQANHLGECIEMSHIMEDGNVVAGVLGTNDGETTCYEIVAKDQREVPCVEEIGGGESNEMVEKNSKEKPQEAPQAKIVECRELIISMEKDNENEHKKVLLTVDEGENAEVDKTLNLAKKDTEEIPMEVTEVEEVVQEQISTVIQGGAGEERKEVPQMEHIDMAGTKVHAQFDTEKHREVAEVGRAEMDGTDKLTGRDADGKPGDVSEIGNAEIEKHRVLIEKDTDEKLAVVSGVDDAQVEELKGLIKEGTNKKFEEVPELGNIGMGGTHGTMEEDANGKLNESPDVTAEVEQANGLEMGNDRPEGILQVDRPESGDARWLAKEDTEESTTEVPQVNHEKLSDETPIVGHISEKPSAYGEDLPDKDVNESKEVYQVEQVEGDDCKVLREKDTKEETKDALGVEQEEGQGKALTGKDVHGYVEEITVMEQVDPQEFTQAQGKEIDKDMMEASNNSIRGEISCNSASIQSKGKQKEAPDECIVEKQCIQDVELINERESSSDAAAMKVEGVDAHKTLDMNEEVATEMIQDHGIICENKETRILEDSHKLDSGLKSDLVILVIDGTQDTEGIHNRENLDLDKQQTMEERQDLGTTVEIKKMEISEDATMLGCSEFRADPPAMEVNEVESTKEIQNQEHLGIKEVMEKRLACGIIDGTERPFEEANTVGSSGVDTISVAVDVSKATSVKDMQNQEACSMEESQAREEKQHHGVGNVNEKRILGGTSTIDCGELKSDTTIVGVDGVESIEGSRNQWALSMAKEPAVQGKLDQGMADENIRRILVDTDAIECGVKPDGTMKIAHDTIPTGQVDIAGVKISFKGVPSEDHNKSDIEGSESNQTARKELEGALPPEFENQVEVKQEKLENKMEMSIGRENDEASEQDQTSTEDAIIAPSGTDDQGENNKEWAEESIKSYGKYTSDPVNTACQPSKFCRPSIEEVRRIHSGRSIYLKDIKESQGRFRSEPSNRVHINNVGHYSRHAAQEPVSVIKDVKVALHDSSRVCGRDRAPELVVTGPPEESSRWRQEQYALQILEDVQNSRIAEKTRMEMEIRVLKAQIASMQRQVMNMDHVGEVISRSKRH